MGRFDRDSLLSTVDTLMESRQPVAHTALIVEPNSLAPCVRSRKGVSRYAGVLHNNRIFAIVWNEDDARYCSILRTMDGVGLWAPALGVSDKTVATVAAGVG